MVSSAVTPCLPEGSMRRLFRYTCTCIHIASALQLVLHACLPLTQLKLFEHGQDGRGYAEAADTAVQFLKIQQLYAKQQYVCGLRAFQLVCHAQKRAGAKGFGLYTLEDLKEGQFIIEYIGEVCSPISLFSNVMLDLYLHGQEQSQAALPAYLQPVVRCKQQ